MDDKRADEYSALALGCVELARELRSEHKRAVLLQMALIWTRLAERATIGDAPATAPDDS